MQLKTKSTQVRLSDTAYRFRWKLSCNTWWHHLLLLTTVPAIMRSKAKVYIRTRGPAYFQVWEIKV